MPGVPDDRKSVEIKKQLVDVRYRSKGIRIGLAAAVGLCVVSFFLLSRFDSLRKDVSLVVTAPEFAELKNSERHPEMIPPRLAEVEEQNSEAKKGFPVDLSVSPYSLANSESKQIYDQKEEKNKSKEPSQIAVLDVEKLETPSNTIPKHLEISPPSTPIERKTTPKNTTEQGKKTEKGPKQSLIIKALQKQRRGQSSEEEKPPASQEEAQAKAIAKTTEEKKPLISQYEALPKAIAKTTEEKKSLTPQEKALSEAILFGVFSPGGYGQATDTGNPWGTTKDE